VAFVVHPQSLFSSSAVHFTPERNAADVRGIQGAEQLTRAGQRQIRLNGAAKKKEEGPMKKQSFLMAGVLVLSSMA